MQPEYLYVVAADMVARRRAEAESSRIAGAARRLARTRPHHPPPSVRLRRAAGERLVAVGERLLAG